MIFNSPGFLESICSAVANGGSPIDFCVDNKLLFSDLTVWLSEDPERQKKYNSALLARDEWLIQAVLRELRRIATIDIREAFDSTGCLRPITELSSDLASVISAIEIFEEFSGRPRELIGYTKKIKFWDKISALEMMGKNLAMFIERHDHLIRGAVTVMPAITVDDRPLRFDLGSNN